MRVPLAVKKARAGQRVRLHASLRAGMTSAYCEVFSSVNGDDPSPHIQLAKMGATQNNRPMMYNATVIRLSSQKPVQYIELIADENCRFHLMQDIDLAGDPTVKARVETYGRFKEFIASARRWLSRNANGRYRRGNDPLQPRG